MLATPGRGPGARLPRRGAKGGMDRRLRERVRWGNVGRASAAVAAVALVAAWPALAPDPPVLPGREAVAVVPAPAATPRAAPPARPHGRDVRPRRRAAQARRRAAQTRRRAAQVRRRGAPARPRRRERRVVRDERRAGEGGGGAVRERRLPAAPVAPPAPAPPVARAAPPIAPAAQGAPAPADQDPVMREFGPEGP